MLPNETLINLSLHVGGTHMYFAKENLPDERRNLWKDTLTKNRITLSICYIWDLEL